MHLLLCTQLPEDFLLYVVDCSIYVFGVIRRTNSRATGIAQVHFHFPYMLSVALVAGGTRYLYLKPRGISLSTKHFLYDRHELLVEIRRDLWGNLIARRFYSYIHRANCTPSMRTLYERDAPLPPFANRRRRKRGIVVRAYTEELCVVAHEEAVGLEKLFDAQCHRSPPGSRSELDEKIIESTRFGLAADIREAHGRLPRRYPDIVARHHDIAHFPFDFRELLCVDAFGKSSFQTMKLGESKRGDVGLLSLNTSHSDSFSWDTLRARPHYTFFHSPFPLRPYGFFRVFGFRQLADSPNIPRPEYNACMFTVYVIYNREHGKIYIGKTKDLRQRLELHKTVTFPNAYTARFSGEWMVIYTEQASDRTAALRREKQLKSFRGREFVKKHIPR